MNQNIYNNNMNQQNSDLPNNQKDNVEDPLYYIKGSKKVLKFTTINTIPKGEFINVKIPISITKSDLYTIARIYQINYYSKIILSYNNYLLKEDDSSIEGIPEGSIINIIEDVDYPDETYYDNLIKNNQNEEIKCFIFQLSSGSKRVLSFPSNISINEMRKAVFSKLHLNSKSSSIIGLNSYDQNSKINIFNQNMLFQINEPDGLNCFWKLGKTILANIFPKSKEKTSPNYIIQIGDLNSTKKLLRQIEIDKGTKIKEININGKIFKPTDEIDFRTIGINEDFNCIAEIENDN